MLTRVQSIASLPVPAVPGALTGDNPHLSPLTTLPPEALRCLAAARADNTRRAYAADLRAFLAGGGRVPCTDREVAVFLSTNAHRWTPSTLARRVAAIAHAHRTAGDADPTRSPLVRDVLRGLRRLHGRPARQVQPWQLGDLDGLGEDASLSGRRDRALLGLGFATGMRRAELVGLDLADLSFAAEGLRAVVRAGKGDPERSGRLVAVARRPVGLCPVGAVEAWIREARLASGPLFRPVDRWGRVRPSRLSPGAVAAVVKRHADSLGLDPRSVSGHSLRAGFVTAAVRAEVPLNLIQRQTGHRSLAVLQRYVRLSDPYAASDRLWACGSLRAPVAAEQARCARSDAEVLQAASGILLRQLRRESHLADPSAAAEFLRMRLAGLRDEVFFVVYLDTRHAVLAAEPAFNGTIDHAEVHPRVIVRRALELNAAALICAHNHPSGNPEPSAADRAVTARIKQALALVDARLLDHFVVTGSGCVSLASRGWV